MSPPLILVAETQQDLRHKVREFLEQSGFRALPAASSSDIFNAMDRMPVGAVVPLSAFAEKDPSRHLVRLCFGKKDETIDAGVAAMAKAKAILG